ncbi:hypothetical protein [Herpetosiphon geysericola]|uniref:hypothetical protein n=1 Tax=Herpetosiphon geysericola TaxID=70996 RepID=UPI00128F39F6|nr:hypothetical protein [Herpetosiphon geysericola]
MNDGIATNTLNCFLFMRIDMELDCLCAEIDAADRPCIACEAQAIWVQAIQDGATSPDDAAFLEAYARKQATA